MARRSGVVTPEVIRCSATCAQRPGKAAGGGAGLLSPDRDSMLRPPVHRARGGKRTGRGLGKGRVWGDQYVRGEKAPALAAQKRTESNGSGAGVCTGTGT
eukprot:scaffold11182_cov122-Isochrysis_galbana.AAC.3